MSNASALFRSLLVYGLCLPLAVWLGYLVATPLDFSTLAVVGIVLFILLIPLLLRWHHAWLIATWNMSAVLFFVPGRPQVWMGMAGISLLIGVLQSAINRDFKFLHVPSVTRPLLFLLAVVLVTARATGGIGLRAFGSEVQGGRYYVFIAAAVLGYFALTSRQIPPKRAGLYLALFCLGAATMAIGELPRVLPRAFDLLFLVFPVMGVDQSTAVVGPAGGTERIGGLCALGMGFFFTMLVRYGIRGILLEPGKSWRVVILAASFVVALMGGYRSALIIMVMTFALLFYLERLHRTRLLPVLVIAAFLGGALTIAFANRLPFWVQRSLAFLPVDIDPVARASAQASSEWRLQMWRDVLLEVPQYLILGKGYGFNARDMNITAAVNRGGSGLAATELAGDYHNGPLSVIIPFGIFGMLGFLWFLGAGLRAIYRNYQFGDPAYRSFNAFLLACFGVKIIFFFVVFGGFATGLMEFTGLVGLSVSLNGGVAKPVVAPQPSVVFNPFKLQPSVRRPIRV